MVYLLRSPSPRAIPVPYHQASPFPDTARYIKRMDSAQNNPCGPSGVTMIAPAEAEQAEVHQQGGIEAGPLAAEHHPSREVQEAGKKRRHEDPTHADPELTLPERAVKTRIRKPTMGGWS